MITRVRVKNYRSIEDIDVTLGPLTVLVGRNGSGKSAFVDVLRFVRDAIRRGLYAAITERQGIFSLRRWSRIRPYDIEFSIIIEQPNYWAEYAFILASKQRSGEYRVKRESCRIGAHPDLIYDEYEIEEGKWKIPPSGQMKFDITDQSVDPTALVLSTIYVFSERLARLYGALSWGGFYTVFPNTLRLPQSPGSEMWLEDDGSNLASVLRSMKRKSEWYPDFLAALSKVVEGVTDVNVRPAGGYLITEITHQMPDGNSPAFALALESDGTVRTVALLAAIYHMADYHLIAIEEPELAIHPGALGVLSDVLQEAATRHQILITTQSPDLISRFGAEQLRVVERVNGVTKIGLLEENQRDVIEKQLFSAGDLLRVEGLHRDALPAAGGGGV